MSTFFQAHPMGRDSRGTTVSSMIIAWLLAGMELSSSADVIDYRVEVVNSWSHATHPGAFPSGAHFSWIGGATHNDEVSFWKEGETASPGMVQMAETGVTSILEEEIGKAIEEGNADQFIGRQHWFCPAETSHSSCGDASFTIRVNSEFPQLTLVSMLGPSPDWFVGMSGFSLRDEHGWRPAFTFELYPYDGGSRQANQFALFGEKSDPQEPIQLITETSGQLVGPQSLGRLHFRPSTFLKLIMDQERIHEKGGTLEMVITLSEPSFSPLPVSVACDDPSAIECPREVSIEPGEQSKSFIITARDNAEPDGPRAIPIRVTSAGYAGSVAVVTILDDEGPPNLRINREGPDQIILTWDKGLLQSASGLSEIWTTVEGATSPHRVRIDSRSSFFRLEYR